MKQTLLFACLLSLIGAHAQSYYPSAYTLPEAGFDAFRNENPYITLSVPDSSTPSQWTPFQRFMRYKAPNVPYTGIDRVALSDADVWTEVQTSQDSFVLNGSGQIVADYSSIIYNYPGFANQYKQRLNMTYNAEGQLVNLKGYEASPPTSNNYLLSSTVFTTYDSLGKRIKDSMVYSNNPPFITYYTYDSQGNVILDVTLQNGDTSNKSIINYNSNNLIETYVYMGFDNSSDEWMMYGADTFTYTNNLVSQHISYGLVFRDATLSFEPFMNEMYTYTSSDKLESIEYMVMQNEIWTPSNKTVFTYGSNDKPVVGYIYSAEGSGWSTVPSNKYLFDNFITSTPSIDKEVAFTLYPNPANEALFIQTQNQPASIVLTDIKGRIVFQGKTSGDTQIPTSAIANGLYFVTVTTQQGTSTQRIVINH